ncbi:MAG: polyphosphate polymerase domain-containing protein [Planctomycetaceae bacterium]|nr:polyphosphate polymerase domain-containing protein [Planctomycetaceae bacterium]
MSIISEQPADLVLMDTPNRQKTRRIELKYLVSHQQAEVLRRWAMERMMPDPFASETGDCSYQITSLYLDTPDFDIFHRQGDRVRGKYRLRRYGTESLIWLETKRKSGSVVRKRRTCIPECDISGRLLEPDGTTEPSPAEPIPAVLNRNAPTAQWDGEWFRHLIHQHSLRPATVICYRRFAMAADSPRGPIRLTIDDQIQSQPESDWCIPNVSSNRPNLLPDGQILELKFTDVLPPLFRHLLLDNPLDLTAFSKYRAGLASQIPVVNTDELS